MLYKNLCFPQLVVSIRPRAASNPGLDSSLPLSPSFQSDTNTRYFQANQGI